MRTCNDCEHMHEGERDALAAGKRTYQCYCKPPQAVVLPTQGGITVIAARPGVMPETIACGEFVPKPPGLQ